MITLIQTPMAVPNELNLPSLPYPSPSYTSLPKQQRQCHRLSRPFTQTQQSRIFSAQGEQQQQQQQQEQQQGQQPKAPKKERLRGRNTWVPVEVYLKEKLSFSEKESLEIAESYKVRGSFGRPDSEFVSRENADAVIFFFKECCGFDSSVIEEIVRNWPRVLSTGMDTNLVPQLGILKDLGFSNTDDIAEAFIRVCKHFKNKYIRHVILNVTMLETEYGVSKEKLRKLLLTNPTMFRVENDKLRGLVVSVEEKWGVRRDSDEFLPTLYHLGNLVDRKINTRLQIFLNFAWTMSDVLSLFKASDIQVIRFSRVRLKQALKLYMDTLGYTPAYLVSNYKLFGVDLEVVPVRHRVLLNLRKRGLIEENYELASALVLTEEEFFNKFVSPYVNVAPELAVAYIYDRSASYGAVHQTETSGDES